MRCSKVKKMLSVYIDGELDKKKREKISQHLGICNDCYKEFSIIEKINNTLKSQKSFEPSEFFETKLFAKIEELKLSSKQRWWKIIFQKPVLVPTCITVFLVLFNIFNFVSFIYAISTKNNKIKEKVLSLAIEKFIVSPSIINIASVMDFCNGCDKILCECIRKENPSPNCVCGECSHHNEQGDNLK